MNDLDELIENIRKIIEELAADNEDFNNLLDRFFQLDLQYQLQLVNHLKEPFEKELEEEENIQGWLTCLKEGHDWTDWVKGYQKEKTVYYPLSNTDCFSNRRGIINYINVPIWVRKCKRCNIEETRKYQDIPDEIKELVKKRRND